MQVPWKQHPVAHETDPQAGPGTQTPCGEQFVPGGHWTHIAPPLPHAKFSCAANGTHDVIPPEPVQHPGHVIALHPELGMQRPCWHVSLF